MSATDSLFPMWAIVEVMGHQTFAGQVSEQTIGGASFVRVDVPQVGDIPAFCKFIGGASIYAMTPVSEQVARLRAEKLRKAPLEFWDLPEAARNAINAARRTEPGLPAAAVDPSQVFGEDDDHYA